MECGLQTFVFAESRAKIENQSVLGVAESNFIRSSFIVEFEVNSHISIVGEECASHNAGTDGERAADIYLTVLQVGEVFEENLTQLFSLSVVVNLLALYDRRHLHFFFGVEGKCLLDILLWLFATNDIALAKEVEHLLHLLFQSKSRSRYILNQQRCDEVKSSREEQLVTF